MDEARNIKIFFGTIDGKSTIMTIPNYTTELSSSMTKMIISDIIGSGALSRQNGIITKANKYQVLQIQKIEYDMKS